MKKTLAPPIILPLSPLWATNDVSRFSSLSIDDVAPTDSLIADASLSCLESALCPDSSLHDNVHLSEAIDLSASSVYNSRLAYEGVREVKNAGQPPLWPCPWGKKYFCSLIIVINFMTMLI